MTAAIGGHLGGGGMTALKPAFLNDIARGRFGLRMSLSPHLALVEQSATWARMVDREREVGWTFAFHDLRLDLGADLWPQLQVDAERQTRLLFASMARSQPPRSADPSWTPLIEIERFELPGGAGLTV